MAQTGITIGNLAVGEPWSSSKALAFNNAINDNDTRLTALTSTSSRVIVMNDAIIGFISQYEVADIGSFQTFEAPINITLTTLQMTITDNVSNPTNNPTLPFETSTAGILTIDLQLYNTSSQSWGTILTTRPTIVAGIAGRGTQSNNATFATANIDAGQLIRIVPVSFKDRQGSFHIQCTAEAR